MNPARALELLDPVKPYDHAPASEFWPAYLRGQAYLQLKDGRAAGVQFRGHPEHRGEAPTSPLYPLAHLGARARGGADRGRRPGPQGRTSSCFCPLERCGLDASAVERSATRVRPAPVVHSVVPSTMSSLHQRAKDVFLAALDRPPPTVSPLWRKPAVTTRPCGRRSSRCWSFTTTTQPRMSRRKTRPRPMFAPGEVFAGRYRMIARIGRGGMGDVWRADDLVLETPVALKLIHSTDPDARERILNEVRLARQITHPAVCRVFDVGEAEGGIFYSMELVRGRGPRRASAARRPAALREGRRHRPSAVRRSGGGARARRPASRSQAGERAHRRRRAGADHRFRDRDSANRRRSAHAAPARRATWRRNSARRVRRSRSGPTSTRSVWCCTNFWSEQTHSNDPVKPARCRSPRPWSPTSTRSSNAW